MGNIDTATLPSLSAPISGAASSSEAAGTGAKRLKLILAVLALPVGIGFSTAAYEHFFNFVNKLRLAVFGWPENLVWFALGSGIFTLMAILIYRPIACHVFAHETVHALATWMCLGRVSNLKAAIRGGQITTSKSNTFTRLSPYCIPFYAFLAVAVYCGLNEKWRSMSDFHSMLNLLLGFFCAFHIGFTLWRLHREQPDLQTDGWLFSLVVILLGNIFTLTAILGLVLSGEISESWKAVRIVCLEGADRSLKIYAGIISAVADAIH